MNQTANSKFLLIINGPEQGNLLDQVFSAMEKAHIHLIQVNQLTIHGLLSVLVVFEISNEGDLSILEKILQNIPQVQFHLKLLELQTNKIQHHPYILTLLGRQLSPSFIKSLLDYFRQWEIKVISISPLHADGLQVSEIKIKSPKALDRQKLMSDLLELRTRHYVDLALQPDDLFRRNKRLAFLDADKTFIQCEMINEISKLSGYHREVGHITEQAMNGQIDFKEALIQRVATLKGVRVSDLERLILSIPYTEGVERLVGVLKMLGYRIGIVSGGFSMVIDYIKERFDLDYGFANTLEIRNGKLTGRILGDIIDGSKKAQLLREVSRQEKITMEQVIAVGDGANDLEMLSNASLGIAFNANRFIRERATGSLSLPNLDALLFFLGIPHSEVEVLDLHNSLS